MMLKRIWGYRRSLIVQLTVLSLGAVLLFLGQYFILPQMAVQNFSDPVFNTLHQASYTIRKEAKENNSFDTIDKNKLIQTIKIRNPKFRYFLMTNHGEHSFGGEPIRLNIPKGDYKISTLADGSQKCSISSSGQLFFMENGLQGLALYSNCGLYPYYIETAGVAVPVAIEPLSFFESVKELPLFAINRYLYIGSGVLLIALFTLFQAIYSLRKLANYSKKIKLGEQNLIFPESKLPLEVFPLVRALNEMLQRLEKSHTQQSFFLSAAAHELRTPLTILRTRIEQLQDGVLKDEIIDDVRRLYSLMNQLLKLTNLTDSAAVEASTNNLLLLTRSVCASRFPLAAKQKVSLEMETEISNMAVQGNTELISTAITNLIDNAISVCSAGDSILITVTKSGEVLVKDNGPGIPENIQGKMFDAFSKTPPNRQGFGLGLTITRAIMDLHGGDVSFKNNPSGGAIFILHFKQLG